MIELQSLIVLTVVVEIIKLIEGKMPRIDVASVMAQPFFSLLFEPAIMMTQFKVISRTNSNHSHLVFKILLMFIKYTAFLFHIHKVFLPVCKVIVI